MLFLAAGVLSFGQKYKVDWQSLRRVQIPECLQKGKFGIYTQWDPYAVHGYMSNTTRYSFSLYLDQVSEARKHSESTFRKLTPEFGYKDLIPLFTTDKFDVDEWAELYQKAGARYVGLVAAYHDGFSMWDTKYSEWNAAKMGPKCDVLGELQTAIKKRDMKYVTAFHHAANWFFFPVHDKHYDTGDPKNSLFYGQYHLPGDGKGLDWKLTRGGLVVEMPEEKPCDHAFVLKIERCHHPKLI